MSKTTARLALACAAVALVLSDGAQAATVAAAGTRISNVARLEWPDAGTGRSIASNQVELVVGEVLDVVLVAGPARPAAPQEAMPFTLTNTGNGSEAFDLSGTIDGGATVRGFAIDMDGDGRFDPAHDRLLDNDQTPAIANGTSLALLAILDGAASASTLTVAARCATGAGPSGTVFAGRGDGGGDAVVGATGGMAELAFSFTQATAAPTLVKTQSVLAPDGTARPLSGAIVTYTLEARFPIATAAARIVDPIPAGATYIPGSLRLDAAALSDAADADAGTGDATSVTVALGDVAAATTRLVQFKVRIQ